MLADRVRICRKKKEVYLAQDADFYGTVDGGFQYIGTEEYIKMPHVIKGVPVTSYYYMFSGSAVIKGIESDNTNVTNMSNMFNNSPATSLDLSRFNTSNVTNMQNMFRNCSATKIDVSSFDTSKVTNMDRLFSLSKATVLDLSSFDTSNVTSMISMFEDCSATTGYARTQADADRFNNTGWKPSELTFVVKP